MQRYSFYLEAYCLWTIIKSKNCKSNSPKSRAICTVIVEKLLGCHWKEIGNIDKWPPHRTEMTGLVLSMFSASGTSFWFPHKHCRELHVHVSYTPTRNSGSVVFLNVLVLELLQALKNYWAPQKTSVYVWAVTVSIFLLNLLCKLKQKNLNVC